MWQPFNRQTQNFIKSHQNQAAALHLQERHLGSLGADATWHEGPEMKCSSEGQPNPKNSNPGSSSRAFFRKRALLLARSAHRAVSTRTLTPRSHASLRSLAASPRSLRLLHASPRSLRLLHASPRSLCTQNRINKNPHSRTPPHRARHLARCVSYARLLARFEN